MPRAEVAQAACEAGIAGLSRGDRCGGQGRDAGRGDQDTKRKLLW